MKHTKCFLLLVVASMLHATIAHSGDLESLHPRPKACYSKPDTFIISKSTPLIVPDSASVVTLRAIWLLETYIKAELGDTLVTVAESSFAGDSGIFIGELRSNAALDKYLPSVQVDREPMPDSQGYVLDVTARRILLCGSDPDGTFNGVSTLWQLMNSDGTTAQVAGAHVWDRPDFLCRFVAKYGNLLTPIFAKQLRFVIDTMAAFKLNGMLDFDSTYEQLQTSPLAAIDSIRWLKSYLAERNATLIPSVANVSSLSGTLAAHPDLAAGLPYSARMIMTNGVAKLVTDTNIGFPNGGFESATAGVFTSWTSYDAPNVSVFVDSSVVHGGRYSARCTAFRTGNIGGRCEFVRHMVCQPFHQYSLKGYYQTNGFVAGRVQLLVTGTDSSGAALPLASLLVKPATTKTSWDSVQVVFTSLKCVQMDVAVGVISAGAGTIWWDDLSFNDSLLVSPPLHRTGAPVHIRNLHNGIEYAENTDLSLPSYQRPSSSAINNGDSLLVSFYYALTYAPAMGTYTSRSAAIAEPALGGALSLQAMFAKQYFAPSAYLLNYSDLRVLNWDSLERARKSTPAVLLGASMTMADSLFRVDGGASDNWMWADMIDTFLFCQDNYDLVNGSLRGIWKLIPPSLTLVDHYRLASRQSFQFLSYMGFRQLFTVTPDTIFTIMPNPFRAWRVLADSIVGMRGAIYLTRKNNYQWLPAFADYLWGAAPSVMHTPLRRLDLTRTIFGISARAFRDPWDGFDSVTHVNFAYYDTSGILINSRSLERLGSSDSFYAPLLNTFPHGLRYKMLSKNLQGLIHEGPLYTLLPPVLTLGTPKPIAPDDSLLDTAITEQLRWTSVALASLYRVQLATDSAFGSTVFDDFVSDTTWRTPPLVHDNTYYWRIFGANDSAYGNWSRVRSFVAAYLPAAPVLVDPTDNLVDTLASFTERWHSVRSTPPVTGYLVQNGTDSSFASDASKALSDTTYPASGTIGSWTYWRVAARNEIGVGKWSLPRRFMYPCLPTSPDPVSPVDGATDVPYPITLSWSGGGCSDSYELVVAADTAFNYIVADVPDIARSPQSLRTLAPNRTYYWRVRGKEFQFVSPFSVTHRFKSSSNRVSLASKQQCSVAVFPNPAEHSLVTVECTVPDESIASLHIVDILGRTVRQISVLRGSSSFARTFDLHGLAGGTYTVRLEAGNVHAEERFVVPQVR